MRIRTFEVLNEYSCRQKAKTKLNGSRDIFSSKISSQEFIKKLFYTTEGKRMKIWKSRYLTEVSLKDTLLTVIHL